MKAWSFTEGQDHELSSLSLHSGSGQQVFSFASSQSAGDVVQGSQEP